MKLGPIRFIAFLCGGLAGISLIPAQAQTFTVIHEFSGIADGGNPVAGLTMDRAGHLYGTTLYGGGIGSCYGGLGCGTVFKLAETDSGSVVTPIYRFRGIPDGAGPFGPVVFGPDGALYGTTVEGGMGTNCTFYGDTGCGTVFKLTPPPTPCRAVQCPWTETVLYRFSGGSDGSNPNSEALVFDAAGNIYGTTELGGLNQGGVVFKLSPSPSGWTESVLYNFTADEGYPGGSVIFDDQGNLYGTAFGGFYPVCGIVYELTPSASGWTETTLYSFDPSLGDPCGPGGPLVLSSPGALYGGAGSGGPLGGGAVFELTYSNGVWTDHVLHAFPGANGDGVDGGGLSTDPSGNLYGTTWEAGAYNLGSVFELTPSGSGWMFIDLHDFTGGGGGQNAVSNVVIGGAAILYGTTTAGGVANCNFEGWPGCGTLWEIRP